MSRYTLPDEHALGLADPTSPFYVVGGFQLFTAAMKAEPRITEAFRTGDGLSWGAHDHGLFEGTERFFRPGYVANLVGQWIPTLDGVHPKLEAGANVVDVGCGHGTSTIVLAQVYPRSHFYGYDTHAPSIERAREAAAEAGVADRITTDYPRVHTGYDLNAFFDCLHDMGDPVGAIQHVRETLAPDGTALIVEPMAGERVEDTLNPVGRIYSAASVLICTPNALTASGSPALGTIATEQQLREIVTAG